MLPHEPQLLGSVVRSKHLVPPIEHCTDPVGQTDTVAVAVGVMLIVVNEVMMGVGAVVVVRVMPMHEQALE